MSKKRVLIDMRMMKPFPTGIGNHYINLVHSLIIGHPEYEYICLVSSRGEQYVKMKLQDVSVSWECISINGASLKQYIKFWDVRNKIKEINADIILTDIW